MSYLGIDIGTSGCKAVAFDAEGKMLGGAHRSYLLKMPQPGWMELDSMEVINACCAVITDAARAAGDDPVRAIAISSQGEAFTPVNDKGEYLGNAMVSSDSRSVELIEPFVKQFGLKRLYGITGHTPSTLFSLFKLLWINQNQPEIWKQNVRFLCFEDLLHLRLGIEPAMGWPLAGRTMLFDVRKHVWSQDILAARNWRNANLQDRFPAAAQPALFLLKSVQDWDCRKASRSLPEVTTRPSERLARGWLKKVRPCMPRAAWNVSARWYRI